MELDVERLRSDLIDYFDTAMYNGYSIVIIELFKIEYATDEEIIRLAQNNNFDLNIYIKKVTQKYKYKT